MTLPFFLLPTRVKRSYLQRVIGSGLLGAMAFAVATETLAQTVNAGQNRNASSTGQVTVLPDASTKTPNIA